MTKKTVAGLVLIVACFLAVNASANTTSPATPNSSRQVNNSFSPFVAGNVSSSLHINGLSENSNVKYPFFEFGARNGADIVRFMPQLKIQESGLTIALFGAALSGFVLISRKPN
jgi:hypothetical protein